MKRRAVAAVVGVIVVGTGVGTGVGAGAAAGAEPIPLSAGLTVVTAVNDESGDYQTITVVERADDQRVRAKVSGEVPIRNACADCSKVRRITAFSNVLRFDRESSHLAKVQLTNREDALYPGYGAPSRAMLVELKERGETTFYWTRRVAGGSLGKFGSAVRRMRTLGKREAEDGKLRRVGAVTFPVLVNDRRVELPAVLARGRQQGRAMEILLLDDPDNPLLLRSHLDIGVPADPLGIGGEIRSEVVQIRFPDPSAPPRIDTQLADEGRVEVDGIYFDFGSDALRPESEPVLADIAQALARHPEWRLLIEGHTDDIGGDDYNLELSRRRAAAVKAALASRFHIDAARLDTEGFGATRPRESNATLAGRARNRRVELVRR